MYKTVYQQIEKFREMRKIPKMEFYKLIGMSSKGYVQMVQNNSIKLSTLQKMADVLKVEIGDFFPSDKNKDIAQEETTSYGNNDMIAVLKEISKLKDEIITLHKELAATKESQSIQPKKSTPKLAEK